MKAKLSQLEMVCHDIDKVSLSIGTISFLLHLVSIRGPSQN